MIWLCPKCAARSTQPDHVLEVMHRCPKTKALQPLKAQAQAQPIKSASITTDAASSS